jgi:flagellar motor switch/type III secretory pathway protein FliN
MGMTDGGTPVDTPGGGEAGSGPVSVSELRVAVDFDIGHLSIPVATLSQWQPGALVELGTPATENGLEVTIRVNGEIIGQGDLVRIDDRLAVRINRLLLAAKG